MEPDQPSNYLVDAQFPSAESFRSVLSTVRPGESGQTATVAWQPDGLTVKWEHQRSRSMQSGVYLAVPLFLKYSVRRSGTVFAVSLSTLLDALAALAACDMGPLSIRYPGPNAELLLEASEEPAPADTTVSTEAPPLPPPAAYARVATLEAPPLHDLAARCTDPLSSFILPGALLKEALDDLEWTGGSVALELQRSPPSLAFSSRHEGRSLQVDIPPSTLISMHVASESIRWEYKMALLRAAFSIAAAAAAGGGGGGGGVAGSSGLMTKVMVDANGLLKATHMMTNLEPAAAAAARRGGMAVGGGREEDEEDMEGEGGGGDAGAALAVVQVMVVAQWEDEGAASDEG